MTGTTAKQVAIIPARLGSKRLPKKNLLLLETMTLIESAVQRTIESHAFDEVWVSSESEEILDAGVAAGARAHVRPTELADDNATSEDFIEYFLNTVDCQTVFQIHSIAPLISSKRIAQFTDWFERGRYDTGLTTDKVILETLFQGKPVNFSLGQKDNSQDLPPLHRINWAMSAWRKNTFLKARSIKQCATYSGTLGYFGISAVEATVVKEKHDLVVVRALLTTDLYKEIPH